MAKLARVSLEDLDVIINNLKGKGEDATQLEALRGSHNHRFLDGGGDTIDDDEHVRLLIEQSPIEGGENLECQVCHAACSKLISGVCEPCFRAWALTTKKKRQ
jgi:hypothetical protein